MTLKNEIRDLEDRIRELEHAAALVVSAWEGGDLAGAVNDLAALIEYDPTPCCPDPDCGGNPCTFPDYARNH